MAETSMSNMRGKAMAAIAVLTLVVAAFAVCASLGDSDAAGNYKITFETNGGTEIAPIENIENGAILYEVLATVEDPEKEGYEFLGWYNKSLDREVVMGSKINSNMTLYAKWFNPLTQCKVDFAADGEHGYQMLQIVVDKDSKVTAPKIAPISGYEFIGWYSYDFSENKFTKFDFNTPITTDTLLYGMWEEINSLDQIVDLLMDNIVSVISFILCIGLAVAYFFIRNPMLLILIIILLLFTSAVNNLVTGGSPTY